MWLLPRVCDARVAFLGRHYRGARCRAAGRLCRAFLFFPAAENGTKLHQMALCPLSCAWTSSAPGLLTSPAGCEDLGVAQPNTIPSASGAHRRSTKELCSPTAIWHMTTPPISLLTKDCWPLPRCPEPFFYSWCQQSHEQESPACPLHPHSGDPGGRVALVLWHLAGVRRGGLPPGGASPGKRLGNESFM